MCLYTLQSRSITALTHACAQGMQAPRMRGTMISLVRGTWPELTDCMDKRVKVSRNQNKRATVGLRIA